MHLWLLKKETLKAKSKSMSVIFVIIRIEALSFSLFSVRYHISQPPPGKQKLPYLSGQKSFSSTSYHFFRKKTLVLFYLFLWGAEIFNRELLRCSYPLILFLSSTSYILTCFSNTLILSVEANLVHFIC